MQFFIYFHSLMQLQLYWVAMDAKIISSYSVMVPSHSAVARTIRSRIHQRCYEKVLGHKDDPTFVLGLDQMYNLYPADHHIVLHFISIPCDSRASTTSVVAFIT
ncbi:hypothetical protein AMTRI_Chr02g213380 [Amborella trichopoda]